MLPVDEMRDAATAVEVAAWWLQVAAAAGDGGARFLGGAGGNAVGDSDSDATADASCFFVGDAMRQSRKTTILAATVPGCNCNGSNSSSTAATSACPTMHAKQSQLLLLCGDVAAVLLLMLPQMMATTSSASRDQDEDWDVDVALCVANRLLLLPRI